MRYWNHDRVSCGIRFVDVVFIDLSMTIAVHSCPNLDNFYKDISEEARTLCEVNTVVGANGLSKSDHLSAASVRGTAPDLNFLLNSCKELAESRLS